MQNIAATWSQRLWILRRNLSPLRLTPEARPTCSGLTNLFAGELTNMAAAYGDDVVVAALQVPEHRHPDLVSAELDHLPLDHHMKPGAVLSYGHGMVRLFVAGEHVFPDQ